MDSIAYLRIIAFSEPFLALDMVLTGALDGAGQTRPPMWISIFCAWCVRLPLAWVLALVLHIGTAGVWMATSVTAILAGLLITWVYQSKVWLTSEV